MYKLKEIADKVYYVGVNDRQKALFENMWPLPYGVSYNSYLIVDEKTVLIDTVDVCYSDIFLKKVADALDGRSLDYLVVNHMEPDHAGSIRLLRQQYPDVQIVGNNKTFGMLVGYHGIKEGLFEVKEGDTLNTGRHELVFYMAPMVHWPEVMVTYDVTDKIVFSADAFGTYGTLDGGVIDTEMNVEHYWEEMIRYYSNIVGKYGSPVQRALQKLSGLDIQTICSTHGPVWREYASKAIDIYDRMSRYEGEEGVVIIYGSMYGNTEQMAEAIAASLADNGIKNIVMHNVSHTNHSYIIADVFKYRGLIVGCPTYNTQMYPEMEALLIKLSAREIKGRYMGWFGSFTWASAAVKKITEFNDKLKFEPVGNPIEMKHSMKSETYVQCKELAKAMADRLKADRK